MSLSKEQILNCQDLPREKVSVPEWGGHVYVRTMTGNERDAWEDSRVRRAGKNMRLNLRNARATLAAATICDNAGALLFDEKDISALGRKSAAALDRVYEVAQRLSQVTDEDIEELVGNFAGAQSANSGSS